MPIDFPSTPTTNQTYTYNNKLWVFNGSAWVGGTVVSLLPAGSMQMYAGAVTQTVSAGTVTTTSPSGWLLANGNAVSRTTYSALFSAIGTTYGAGNGSTTFNLPDLSSRVPIGVGTGSGLTARTLGGTVGTETVTLDYTQIPAHSHPNTVSGGSTGYMSQNASHVHAHIKPMYCYNPNTNSAGLVGGSYVMGNDTAGVTPVAYASTEHQHTFTPSITNNNNTGGGGSHSNMQPAIGLNYIIKT